MIFEKNLCGYEYIKSKNTNFSSIYNEEDKNILIDLIKRTYNKNFTNGKAVRIDNIKEESKMKLYISKSEFYEFLLSNFILLNYNKLDQNASQKEKDLLKKTKARMGSNPIKKFDDLFKYNFLSNILAVSALIMDRKGKILLVLRNNQVGISNGFLSVSVTGSVDDKDYLADDPVLSCCFREIKEELSYDIEGEVLDLNFKKIVFGENKLQPIALVDILVDDVEKIRLSATKYIKDFNLENSKLMICDKKKLEKILSSKKYKLTEAGLNHLESIL